MIYYDKFGTTFGCANAGDTLIKHSYRNYGLYPRSKPVISPPEAKTMTVDIPGADGALDYTEALTGDVHFNTRHGVFSFVGLGSRKTWESIYHSMLNDLHGKRMGIVIDEDAGGYYYGRLSVQDPEYVAEGNTYKVYITVEAELDPYRYDLYSTIQPWVWDTFPFPTGVIRYYKDIEIDTVKNLTIVGSPMAVVPDIVVKSITTSPLTVRYPVPGSDERKRVTLQLGSNVALMPDFILRNGEADLTFMGSGIVDIVYRGGAL